MMYAVRPHHHLESNLLWHTKPMKTDERITEYGTVPVVVFYTVAV